jgi:hypothetical protein
VNDLDLLTDLAAGTPLPDLSQLAAPRARLEAAIRGEASQSALPRATTMTRPPGYPVRPRRPRPRSARRRLLAASIGAVGVAVAASAAVAVTLPGGGPSKPSAIVPGTVPPSITSTKAPSTPVSPTSVVLPAHLTAVELLHHAATAALSQPTVTPQPDQYVYTKTFDGDGVDQMWLSVDGHHTSLYENGGLPPFTSVGCPPSGYVTVPGVGIPPTPTTSAEAEAFKKKFPNGIPTDVPPITEPCTVQPAYFPDMPTTAGAMGAWLATSQNATPANLNDLAKVVANLMQTDYLLPAQEAALYDYLGTVPGLAVARNVKDFSGRPGIGVAWTSRGSRAMMIFDPATLAYLGMTTWGNNGQQGGDALLQIAVVDKLAEIPSA